MSKIEKTGDVKLSLPCGTGVHQRICIVLAAFMIFSAGLSECTDKGKTEGKKEYIQEIHHSKISPGCIYDIYRTPSGCDETAVLYYFHGSGGNEHIWAQANRKVIDSWKKRSFKSPLVVAVSYGSDWLMFPEEVSGRGVHLETFVHDIMPEIEQHLGGKITRRFLYGFSIGGANVAQLLFRYPELFEKAVIVSPQIYCFSIFAPDEEIDALSRTVNVPVSGVIDWIKRNILKWNSVARNIRRELAQLKWNVPDPQSWARADILANMRRAPEGRRIRVYISCGRQDGNGFFPGSKRLAAQASAHGYYVTFDSLEGGHMALNGPRIASFLEK